jgi:hypothetical protein
VSSRFVFGLRGDAATVFAVTVKYLIIRLFRRVSFTMVVLLGLLLLIIRGSDDIQNGINIYFRCLGSFVDRVGWRRGATLICIIFVVIFRFTLVLFIISESARCPNKCFLLDGTQFCVKLGFQSIDKLTRCEC